MPFFTGAKNVQIYDTKFTQVQGDAYEYNDISTNVDSFNTINDGVVDSFNNYGQRPPNFYGNDPGYGSSAPQQRLPNRRNQTMGPGMAPPFGGQRTKVPRRQQPRYDTYDEEYVPHHLRTKVPPRQQPGTDDDYVPPHQRMNAPPRQQPRYDTYEEDHPTYRQQSYGPPPQQSQHRPYQQYPQTENRGNRWPDYEEEYLAGTNQMSEEPYQNHQSPQSTSDDFDSVFGAFEPPPRQRPQDRNSQRPPQSPYTQPGFTSEPSMSSATRSSSKNPFAQFQARSFSVPLTAMQNLKISEEEQPPVQKKGVTFNSQPSYRSPIAETPTLSSLPGSSLYTEDRGQWTPVNAPEPPRSDEEIMKALDAKAAAIIYRFRMVFSNKDSYRKLLKVTTPKAQRIVDICQALLESPKVDDVTRRELVVAMRRFAKAASVYPRSYRLTGVHQTCKDYDGCGTYGAAYQGTWQNRAVCLKVMKMDWRTPREKLIKTVAREAITWRQLTHPNILPFYGICEVELGVCLVSPWMDNGDLKKYIQNPIPSHHRLLLAIDVAEGLQYLHGYKIVHGDLKGNNVVVDKAGRGRLADFGLTGLNDPSIIEWTSQTKANSKGGTAPWMAPEVLFAPDAGEDKNTEASDMYAWGGVCYELYTGESPYIGHSNAVVANKLKGIMPARPDADSPSWKSWGLTEELWSLMNECWNENPDLRPDATNVLKKLRAMGCEDDRPPSDLEVGHGTQRSFVAQWHRTPTADDIDHSAPFQLPSLAEVGELLTLD